MEFDAHIPAAMREACHNYAAATGTPYKDVVAMVERLFQPTVSDVADRLREYIVASAKPKREPLPIATVPRIDVRRVQPWVSRRGAG